jgi:hypothetical protein
MTTLARLDWLTHPPRLTFSALVGLGMLQQHVIILIDALDEDQSFSC